VSPSPGKVNRRGGEKRERDWRLFLRRLAALRAVGEIYRVSRGWYCAVRVGIDNKEKGMGSKLATNLM
jgi:hypothetical protein